MLEARIAELEEQLAQKENQIEDLKFEERHAEELKKSHATLNSIFEGPENIIAFSLDRNYQYIFFNQAHSQTIKNIWGADIEIGKSMLDYITLPEDRKKAKINFDRALSGENFIELEDYGEEALSRRYWENIYNPIESDNEIIGLTVFCADITERKMTEKALKESEEKFRGIFNNATDMISLNLMNDDDMPGNFLEVNKVACERLGYTKDELLKIGPQEIVAPEKRVEMPENARVLLKNGHNTFEIVHLTKDGRRIPVEVNNHLISFEGQRVCLAITRDISQRKKVEEALKESEEKYRTIFENVQDIFYQTDIKGKIIEISPSVKGYSGFNREDLIGKSVDIVYNNPEDRNKLLKAINENGEVFDYELRLKDKDGRLIYVSVNAHFIFDSNNRPVGVEGSIRNINERKNAENQLKLSQIRLANAMDLANLANWELDLPNQMFTFNDKFYSMIGTTVENEGGYQMSIEYYIKEYVHPEDAQFIADGMKKSIEVNASTFGTEFEHRIIRRDGETRYMAIHIRVILPTETQNLYIYGTVQDITERKIVEEKLKESLEEKEMLLKEIHHRVKNNLMVISSLLNLQSQYINDKEALDIFKESQNRAKSMALIHERLYRSTDLKKIDFGDYIHTLATDLFHTYVPDPGRISLNMNVENVMVDINTTVPLGLIVNELVTNSMKHAFPEGRKGDIDIEFYKKDDEFTLVISDNGVGFPENIDFRNTASLGLQLVNNLVMQIDGEITLDKSHGTKFKITFRELEYKKKS